MSQFVHEPDFDARIGQTFTDYATFGGNVPGSVVADSDGKGALLFGLAANWINYHKVFRPLDQGGRIRCENEIRIESPHVVDIGAFADYELTDGTNDRGTYVRVFNRDGKLFAAAWKEWNQWQRTEPILYVKGGPVNQGIHQVTVDFTQSNVTLTLDDKTKTIQTTNPPGMDTLRVFGVGYASSQNLASMLGNVLRGTYQTRVWYFAWLRKVTVYQYWMMLLRRHRVSGEAK
jgi:hypothetical protein